MNEYKCIVPTYVIDPNSVCMCDVKATQESGGYGWRVMHTDYSFYFKPVLRHPSLPALLTEKYQNQEPTAVLDIMGFGSDFDDWKRHGVPFEHGFTLSLGYWNSGQENNLFQSDNRISHITGNIIYDSTWKALYERMSAYNIHKLGLVILAPMEGFNPDYFPASTDIYNEVIQRIWKLLSVTNGTLLAEIPRWIASGQRDSFNIWFNRVSNMSGRVLAGPSLTQIYEEENNYLQIRLEKTPLNRQLPLIQAGYCTPPSRMEGR